MRGPGVELLSPSTVGAYLARRRLAQHGSFLEAVELGGEDSNVVLGAGPYVVKQALPRLRVAEVGSTIRSERTVTWNQPLRLEAEIGSEAAFAGRAALPLG